MLFHPFSAVRILLAQRVEDIDQRGGNDHAIGDACHASGHFRRLDPEAHHYRQLALPPAALDGLGNRGLRGGRAARRADHRDAIEKTAKARTRHREIGGIERRGGKRDHVEPVPVQRLNEGVRLAQRQVGGNDAVDPGFCRLLGKAVDPERDDRIGIAHQHQRRLVVVLAEGAAELEGAGEIAARRHRPPVGLLDGCAVEDRI